MDYSFRSKIADHSHSTTTTTTAVDENGPFEGGASMVATATRLNYKGSKASFTLRPALDDTSNIQQKAQPKHKHRSISTDTTAAAAPLPLDVDDLSSNIPHKRRRLEQLSPFPVLPIQLPEYLRPLSSSSTSKRQNWSLSTIETRSRTRLYEKGVPPRQIFDYNNNKQHHHHRPKEPFACAKNQMGWVNAPSVVEYEHEIYQHLREIELKILPEQDYASYHEKGFDWDTRSILMNWMIALHSRFRLRPETLYLSINIADRFLSRQPVPRDDLSLVIITSLVIGCKYEEGLTPCVAQLVDFAGHDYTEREVHVAERYILEVIDYNLAYPNPLQFWRRIIKDQPCDRITSAIAQYLIEISCVDHHFLYILPSKIGAAAVYLSRSIARKSPLWTKEFIDISGYAQVIELKQVAQLMVNYLSKPIEDSVLFRKWSAKQLLGISLHVRDWILLYHRNNMRSKG